MPGTFIIRAPTSVSQNVGTVPASWGAGTNGTNPLRPTDDASLLLGINSSAADNPALYAGWDGNGFIGPSGTWRARFGFGLGDAVISLDGAPPISFNSLPSGIYAPTATLKIDVGRYPNVSGDVSGDLFFQRDILTESGDLNQSASLIPGTKSFIYAFLVPGHGEFLDIINDGFGIRCVFTAGLSLGQQFINARIEGTWDTDFYQFDFPLDGDDVAKGEVITITSPGTDPLTDLDLSELTLSLPCGTIVPIIQTQTLFTFLVPITCAGAGTQTLSAIGNGVQFSGSVALGTLDILDTNGSGIYELVPNKSNDTLYSDHRDGTTVDVKIPNPFGKTGFIGG